MTLLRWVLLLLLIPEAYKIMHLSDSADSGKAAGISCSNCHGCHHLLRKEWVCCHHIWGPTKVIHITSVLLFEITDHFLHSVSSVTGLWSIHVPFVIRMYYFNYILTNSILGTKWAFHSDLQWTLTNPNGLGPEPVRISKMFKLGK